MLKVKCNPRAGLGQTEPGFLVPGQALLLSVTPTDGGPTKVLLDQRIICTDLGLEWRKSHRSRVRTGKMAGWLRALAVLEEDGVSQFLTPIWQLTTTCNSNSRGCEALL